MKLEDICCKDAVTILGMCCSQDDPIFYLDGETSPMQLINYGEISCPTCKTMGAWDLGALPDSYEDAAFVKIKYYTLLGTCELLEGTLLDMVMDRLGIEWA